MATFDVSHCITPVSSYTSAPPMAVITPPLPQAARLNYIEDYVEKYVTNSNPNSAFLEEDITHLENYSKIQSVFDTPVNKKPLMCHVNLDGNWDIDVGSFDIESDYVEACTVDLTKDPTDDTDSTIDADPDTGGGVPDSVQKIIDKYQDRFDLTDTSPANVPVIHVPLKPEYKNRTFYRSEPERSV